MLSGRGARVYTAHTGWLGVVTGISAALTGGVLIHSKSCNIWEMVPKIETSSVQTTNRK